MRPTTCFCERDQPGWHRYYPRQVRLCQGQPLQQFRFQSALAIAFLDDAKRYGRAPGSRPKSNAAHEPEELGCWPSSTSSTAGFTRTPLKAVRSSMFCWRPKEQPGAPSGCGSSGQDPRHGPRFGGTSEPSGPAKFAQVWHMLMKGSIVSACEGNRNAAREAKQAARIIIHNWQCGRKSVVSMRDQSVSLLRGLVSAKRPPHKRIQSCQRTDRYAGSMDGIKNCPRDQKAMAADGSHPHIGACQHSRS